MPNSDPPQYVNFSPADAAELRRVQLELVRLFGPVRAAAAANLIAVGMARARGITPEQHGLELVNAYDRFDSLAAGGGSA
jgi:hypothetical protein